MKNLLIILFSGIFLWSCNDEKEHEIIKKELMQPYFELLLKEDYNSAYQTFTSPFYRGHSDFNSYLDSYRKITAKKGKLKEFKIKKIETLWNISGETEYNVEVSVSFQKQESAMPIVFGVSKSKEGKYKINHGWFQNKYGIPHGFDGPY